MLRQEEVEEEQDEDGPDAASADYPEEPGREAAAEGESPSFQSLRSWLLSEGIITSPGDVSPPQWSPDRSLSPVLDLPGVEPEPGTAPPALASARNPLEMTSPVLVFPRPRLPSDLLLAPASSRKRLSSHLASQQPPPGDLMAKSSSLQLPISDFTATSSSSWQLPPSDLTAMSSSSQQAPPNDLMVMSSSSWQPPPGDLMALSSSRQPPPSDLTAMSSSQPAPPGDVTVTSLSSQQALPGDLKVTLSSLWQLPSRDFTATSSSSSSRQLPPSDLTVMLSSQHPLPSELTVTSSLSQQPPHSDLTATPSLRQLPELVLPRPLEALSTPIPLPLPPSLTPPPPLGWEPSGEGWGGPEGPALLLLSRYSQATTPARGLVTGPALRGLLGYVTGAPAPSPRGRRLLQRLARHPACLEPLVRCRAPGLLRAWLILGLRPCSAEGPGSRGEEVEEPGSPGEGPGNLGRAPEGPRSPGRVPKRPRSLGKEAQEPRSPGWVPKKPHHLAEGPRSPGEALEEPRSPVPRFKEFGESLLLGLRVTAESPFGAGVLTHMLLSGPPSDRLACALAVPLLCRKELPLCRKLLLDHSGLALLTEALARPPPPPFALYAVDALALLLGSPHGPNNHSPPPAGPTLPCPYAHLMASGEADLRFLLDCGAQVPASRQALDTASDVFRAMLGGGFAEARLALIPLRGVALAAFLPLLHHLHGCRGCQALTGPFGIPLGTRVLEVAGQFLAPGLVDEVEGALSAQYLAGADSRGPAQLYGLAEQLGHLGLQRACVRHVLCGHYPGPCQRADALVRLAQVAGDERVLAGHLLAVATDAAWGTQESTP